VHCRRVAAVRRCASVFVVVVVVVVVVVAVVVVVVVAVCACVCVCVYMCVDARDARGCVSSSTLPLGCQMSSRCCPACASLAAYTRCLQLLCSSSCCCCCCCVPSACLYGHGIAVCRVSRRQVPAGCVAVPFWGHSHTVLCISDSMQCAHWLSA
jgi:hypothetical protein